MINVLELFGGIRSIEKAFINLNIKTNILDYIENDPKVVTIANAMFQTNYQAKSVINYHYLGNKKVDLLIGGSPCQDFSLAGKNIGGDENKNTRSSLIWEQLRILSETMPKYYIWENVKNVLSKKHKIVFDKHNEFVKNLGYKVYYKILNAKDFGIPQNRERVFIIAIRKDLKQEFNFDNLEKTPMKPLSNFLEKNVDDSYFIKGNYLEKNKDNEFIKMSDGTTRPTFKESSNGIITLPLSKNFTSNKVATGMGVTQTLTTLGNTKILVAYKTKNGIDKVNIYTVNSENYVYDQNTNKPINTIPASERTTKILDKKNNKNLLVIKWNNQLWNVRILTELECFRLMAFDDGDFYKAQKVATKQQLYKVAGNSILVKKLELLIKELVITNFKGYQTPDIHNANNYPPKILNEKKQNNEN